MPIHDLGYRGWRGRISGAGSRTLAITETGCRLALKSRWARRTMLFAWMPLLVWGVALFATENLLQESRQTSLMELAERDPEDLLRDAMAQRQIAREMKEEFGFFPEIDVLADALTSDNPDESRRVVWRWLLMTYFRYPQAVAMVFLLGFVAPGLIARDIRSRAFYLYFCRPIGRLEYVLGKLAVPTVFLMFISTVPALVLYVAGLFLSPDLSVLPLTWGLPLRVLAASVVLVLPTASLALALSSLTQESRFASFGWFGVWMLGYGAYWAVNLARAISLAMEQGRRGDPGDFLTAEMMRTWSPLSLYAALGDVQSWVFGFLKFGDVWPSVLMLSLLTAGSLTVLWRRIGRNMQS